VFFFKLRIRYWKETELASAAEVISLCHAPWKLDLLYIWFLATKKNKRVDCILRTACTTRANNTGQLIRVWVLNYSTPKSQQKSSIFARYTWKYFGEGSLLCVTKSLNLILLYFLFFTLLCFHHFIVTLLFRRC